MPEVRVRIPNFTPRPYQRRLLRYMDRGGLRAVWVVHRRGGKDLTAMNYTCAAAHRRTAAYWHVFPTEVQGRKALWEGFTKDGQRIMELVFPKPIRKSPREFMPKAEMVVELNCGSIWRLLGSDKISSVGAGPAGVVMSEYSLQKPSAWNYIRPMLRENGGWAIFPYTPRGKNHGFELYEMARKDPDWFCEKLSLFDTRAYDPEATIAAERAEGMPEDLIKQEYLVDFEASNVGTVFGDLLQKLNERGGVGQFEHATDGVHVSFDLGLSDATAIWWWRPRGDGVEFIDHYENSGKPLSHYFDQMDERRSLRLSHIWLPHDARAGTLLTGQSVQDLAAEQVREKRWGAGVQLGIVPRLSPLDRIEAGRWLLQRPDTRIHSRCEDGLKALREYRYAYDEDKKTFSRHPEHDWTSHTADAFAYGALMVRVAKLIAAAREPAEKKPIVAVRPDPLRLDELFKAHERLRRR